MIAKRYALVDGEPRVETIEWVSIPGHPLARTVNGQKDMVPVSIADPFFDASGGLTGDLTKKELKEGVEILSAAQYTELTASG